MAKIKLSEEKINYVRNAVDLTSGKSGYPVLARFLEESGIATREELRYMARKGLLKATAVIDNSKKTNRPGKGTLYTAYYTERHIPEWVTKQEELRKQAEEARKEREAMVAEQIRQQIAMQEEGVTAENDHALFLGDIVDASEE